VVEKIIFNSEVLNSKIEEISYKIDNSKEEVTTENLKGFTREENSEEIFKTQGVVYHPPAIGEGYPEKIQDLESSPFSYSVSTSYIKSMNNGNIVHKVNGFSENLDNLNLSPLKFSKLIPIELQVCRFGYEQFVPKKLSSFSGILPTIKQTFSFYCDREKIEIELTDATSEKKLSSSCNNILNSIDNCFIKLKLSDTFLKEVKEQLKYS